MVATSPAQSSVPARNRAKPRFRLPRLRAIITTAILLPIGFGWIFPFLWMLSAGFKTNQEIFSGLGLIPDDPQFGNFSRAWTDARIGQYFINTTIVTIGSIALVLVSVSMIGYVLGRYSFPGKKLVIALFALTVFLPEGYTIIPIFELVTKLGLANSLLGVTLAQSGGANVVLVLLFAGYFAHLPKELEEAAIVDGAGFFRVFWQIMLPLAKPVIATTIILQFMNSWNAFLQPLVLTLSRPDLRTLAVGIYAFQGEFFTDWSGMAAAATISLAPVVIIFLLLQRYFVEGIAGAVKA
ncbi:MAG TPA: carbohydrate ABC transporter permease [Thermomicrobiales bacterium]|nr:carbohydrate ABC transporter permease [Thermomicrobiales bacterium]